jgi:hypothetical protein
MATGALTETVAEELEQAATITRKLDNKVIGSGLIGLGIGVTIGFYIGYHYSKKKLRVEIFEEAEQEISAIREHYQKKILAAEAQDKESVEEIVRERGYTPEKETGLDYSRLEDPAAEPNVRSIRPSVPVNPPKPSSVSTRRETLTADDHVILINQNDFHLNKSGYSRVSYLYFTGDDTLVDEADKQNILTNREDLVGEKLLDQLRSRPYSDELVYVRNPELELDIVIEQIPKSWDEEVLGFDSSEPG